MAAFLSFLIGTAAASAPFTTDWIYNGEANTATLTSHKVSEQICDVVNQTSGYFNIDAKTDKNYFYWAFDSRSDPENDPVLLWMTGGPGCSSEIALFNENGPCKVEDDLSTSINPYSWNIGANLVFIDQPAGTGFSYADKAGYDSNEAEVGEDMYHFLQALFDANPQWRDNEFFIFGESYGGHFVPATAHRVWLGNKNNEGPRINLVGVSVGNGLTNPEVQYAWYPEYTYNFTMEKLGRPVISLQEYEQMKSNVDGCVKQIHNCQTGSDFQCKLAQTLCNANMLSPYAQTGLNNYDIRGKCEYPPLCYDFSNIDRFLSDPRVLKALNINTAKSKWSECNFDVNRDFAPDWMHNFHTLLPDMLADGIRFLIYAGDCDFICNWLGNFEWTKALDWPGKAAYNAAPDQTWNVGNQAAGLARTAQGLTFLRVYDAGHMVPLDQPENSLAMVKLFLNNRPFA